MNATSSDNGLPFISAFPIDEDLPWQMSRSEKYALIGILETVRPDCSIEIGTFRGGSLQVISPLSKTVYSIDISPEPKRTLEKRFDNVNFIVADSENALTNTFKKIEHEGAKLNFVLIDGDHSRKGVHKDLKTVLDYPHKHEVTVVLHDSYNPQCRRGMKDIDFSLYKNISFIDLDYITGSFWHNNNNREMWGGLALIKLIKNQSETPLVNESAKKSFQVSRLHSSHFVKDKLSFLRPIKKMLYKKFNIKHRQDEIYDFEDH